MENNSSKNKSVHETSIGKERSPGEIVRARRLQMNLSQENLEYSSGVSVSTIGRIERNEVRPSLENIEKLERALDIPLREAFEKYWRSGQEKSEKRSLQSKKLRAFIQMVSSRNLSDDEISMLMDRFLAEGDQQTEELGKMINCDFDLCKFEKIVKSYNFPFTVTDCYHGTLYLCDFFRYTIEHRTYYAKC